MLDKEEQAGAVSVAMKILALTVMAALALTGCAGVRSSQHGPISTQFISSPAGARIEIDGNYVGNAPLTYKWPTSFQDGARFRDQVTIKAYPSGGGQFPQRKFYESFGGVLPLIPGKVYFDMTSRPVKAEDDE